jgi:hypothetical protein
MPWFAPLVFGAIVGLCQGHQIATANGATGWAMAGYMAGGTIVGGLSSYVGTTVAVSGGFMANTMGVVSSSFVNSVGTFIYTGGKTDVSINFGLASYNFSKNEWGYLGKRGNKWFQNMAYAFGAMANLQDAVSLFGGGTDVLAITEKKNAISHAAIVGDNDINISVGPKGGGYFDKNQSFGGKINNLFKKVPGDGNWENHLNDGHGWPLTINNVNKNILTKLSEKLALGENFIGKPLQYSGVGYSCVSYTSRALWAAGIPNIGLHPYLWQSSLFIRQMGISLSPYLYQEY